MSFSKRLRIMVSGLLIISASTWAKKAPEVKSDLPRSHARDQVSVGRALGNSYDNEGFARRLYFPLFSTGSKDPDQIVDGFLRQYAPVLGIDPDNLALISTGKSLGAYHYRFQQQHGDIPVFASQVLVNVALDGGISSVISDYKRNIDVSVQPSIPAAAAINLAEDEIGVESFRGSPESELVIYSSESATALCWRVLIPAEIPLGDWQVFVDAHTGTIVDTRNILVFEDGSGYAFIPNPVVSERTLNLPDSTDRDYQALTNARFNITLEDLDPPQEGYYRLSGPFVNTSPTWNRAQETDPDSFYYNRQSDWFEEVVVYYHLSSCHSFYESLGFDNIMNFSISANVNGTTQDNSWYSPGSRQLTYGSGGVDDAEDADVIVHEYGHATQFDQVTNWGQTHEGGSMGEGFGDYISVAYAHPVFNDWDEAQVFDWDLGPVEHFWPGRRVDEDKHYPEDMQGEVHADGEIWSRCLWDMQNSIAYDTAAQLVLESHFYLTPYANFFDGANAIVEADINLYGGVHLMQIGQAFVDRGILDEMPIELEINHQPLHDTEDLYGPYPVTAIFDHTNPLESARLYYRYASEPEFTMTDMTPTGNDDEYSADLPGPGVESSVHYYIEVTDDMGITGTLPEGAPDSSFEFYAGPDFVIPVIEHDPLDDIPDVEWPTAIAATITDNIGVESAAVEFRVNSAEIESFDLAYVEETDFWEGEFTGSVAPGDVIEYRIFAVDNSSNGNAAYLPEDGFFSFDILQLLEITYMSEGDPIPIPDGDGGNIFDTLVVAEDYEIFDVDVYSNIVHPYIGDLYFVIWSPDNTRLMLHNRTGGDDDNIIGWYDDDFPPDDTLGMAVFNGHRSGGYWRIFLADIRSGDQGTLNQWGVRILGAGEPVAVEDDDRPLPDRLALAQNYPNPFNPSTNIAFSLPESGHARLEIFDLLGRRVATPVDGFIPAGEHIVVWDGRTANGKIASSGIYFARLTAGKESAVIRMAFLK